MSDTWTDRLSEYLDGELSSTERRQLEAHLATCNECAETLADVRTVRARARSLEDRLPAADLWPAIAARIRAGREQRETPPSVPHRRVVRRGITFSVPQLLAAGIGLVTVSAGGAWLALGSGPAPPVGSPPGIVAAAPALPVALAGPGYDRAVAELQALVQAHEGDLDTATVRVLRESLSAIDQAIADAQAALAVDPANGYLAVHLADAMRRKLDLLRRAAQITTAAG